MVRSTAAIDTADLDAIISQLTDQRAHLGRTLHQVARSIGVTPNRVGQWEKSDGYPHMENLLLWVRGLHRRIAIVDIFGVEYRSPADLDVGVLDQPHQDMRRMTSVLRDLRDFRHMSQDAVRAKIHIGRKQFANLEAGYAYIPPLVVCTWVQVFSCRIKLVPLEEP